MLLQWLATREAIHLRIGNTSSYREAFNHSLLAISPRMEDMKTHTWKEPKLGLKTSTLTQDSFHMKATKLHSSKRTIACNSEGSLSLHLIKDSGQMLRRSHLSELNKAEVICPCR